MACKATESRSAKREHPAVIAMMVTVALAVLICSAMILPPLLSAFMRPL